jgi:hypothetical protein
MKITANEITFEEDMHVYRMKFNHDDVFDVQTVNWMNKKAKHENKMFIIDNDSNPVNDEMILF